MANATIPDLTALGAAVAVGDLLEIADVSNANASRKVTQAELVANLGTPTTLVGTNITGTAAGLTAGAASSVSVLGITGMGAGVADLLATFSSENMLASLTTSTGTGNAVFSISPTFTGTVTMGTLAVTTASVTALNPVSNDGAPLGTTALGWSDLHLATGALINVANGNAVITHSSGIFTVSTGDFRVTTAGTNSASVVTVGGTQTLTGKTLTSPTVDTATVNAPSIVYTVEPGADDTAYGERISGLLAGDTIAQWDLVYLDSTSGRWELADADAVATAGGVLLGLAVTSGTDGNALTVLVRGIVRNDGWTWASAGLKLYASLTPGGITTTRPSATDDAIRPIADTLSDDCIWFAPGQFWETHV